MGTFTITFRGLVAHVKYNGATRAVLVNEHDHVPILEVEEKYVKSTTFPEPPVNKRYKFSFKGEFTMTPKPATAANKVRNFDKHVPTLKEVLTNADIDPDAKLGKTSHAGVVGSLDYAGEVADKDNGATIGPDGCFGAQAVWSGGNPAKLPICLAKKVKFSFDPGADVTISDGTKNIVLTPDAEIKITNNIPNGPGNHFHGFKNLTTAAGAGIHLPKRKGPFLRCVGCQPFRGDDPNSDPDLDCSNSQFP